LKKHGRSVLLQSLFTFNSRSYFMKTWKHALSALGAALLVAACGGGGDGTATTSSSGVTTIKVVGDSLTDSGVFGFKFAMQGSAAEPMQIWTERIAAQYGAPALCPRYVATSHDPVTGRDTVALNPSATTCTSYGVGGGRINNTADLTSGQSIPQQLKDLAAEKTYGAGDLLLVDGGGNDAADLVGAFLNRRADGGAAYSTLLGSLLPKDVVGAQLAGGQAGAANAGALYMTALADKMFDAVKTSALDKGAKKVVLLNMPGITNTPRFQATLDLVALGNGGGTAGATVRAQTEAVINSWVVAFNKQLAAKFAGNANVTLVDFYSNFNDQIANPAQYGLTNVKTPACPVAAIGADGLPVYNTPACTSTALSAQTPPAGSNGKPDWWKTYAFSDGFHPTMHGYQLLTQLVTKNLATAGWL
jgi:outer membrane lipase/esterase